MGSSSRQPNGEPRASREGEYGEPSVEPGGFGRSPHVCIRRIPLKYCCSSSQVRHKRSPLEVKATSLHNALRQNSPNACCRGRNPVTVASGLSGRWLKLFVSPHGFDSVFIGSDVHETREEFSLPEIRPRNTHEVECAACHRCGGGGTLALVLC